MQLIIEQFPIVIRSLNIGFLQTLKLFFVTLIGAFPLGLLIAFGSMSHFKPLKYLSRFVVWIIRHPAHDSATDYILFSGADSA